MQTKKKELEDVESNAARIPTSKELKSPTLKDPISAEKDAINNIEDSRPPKSDPNTDREEALIAGIGARIAGNNDIENKINAMANKNPGMDPSIQSQGESGVARVDGPNIQRIMNNNLDALASEGEDAIARGAIEKGLNLENERKHKTGRAKNAIARGFFLAKTKEVANIIAKKARFIGKPVKNQYEPEIIEVEKDFAIDETPPLEIVSAKQPRNMLDPYKILGTVPDNLDIITLNHSSIYLPLKVFRISNARNRAEAGALAAQKKLKENLRGKITAERIESPLNTIKGDGGYLNVPENAIEISIDLGKVYFTEEAEADMEREGSNVSNLIHMINTGQRTDIAVGMGYYELNVMDMKMDVPSPQNPTPSRVLTNNEEMLDISKAEGIDIERGELRLEKWSDYLGKVRAEVNTPIQITEKERAIEAMIDNDSVKNSVKMADAMFNTQSQIIKNPDGPSYLQVTPPYGVSEQVRYDEAAFNLDNLEELKSTSEGQLGVSAMQSHEQNQIEMENWKKDSKRFNVGLKEDGAYTETNAEELGAAILKNAAKECLTRDILSANNTFDNAISKNKQQIFDRNRNPFNEEGIDQKDDLEAYYRNCGFKNQSDYEWRIEEEAKELVGEIEPEYLEKSKNIKNSLIRESETSSKTIGMPEHEFISTVSKISLKTISLFYFYSSHSSCTCSYSNYLIAKSEIKILFGIYAESFIKLMYQFIYTLTGYGDPDEKVIIKMDKVETPKRTDILKRKDSLGGYMKVVKEEKIPHNRIIRIPISRITHGSHNNTTSGPLYNNTQNPLGNNINKPMGDNLIKKLIPSDNYGIKSTKMLNSKDEAFLGKKLQNQQNINPQNNKSIDFSNNSLILGPISAIEQMTNIPSFIKNDQSKAELRTNNNRQLGNNNITKKNPNPQRIGLNKSVIKEMNIKTKDPMSMTKHISSNYKKSSKVINENPHKNKSKPINNNKPAKTTNPARPIIPSSPKKIRASQARPTMAPSAKQPRNAATNIKH